MPVSTDDYVAVSDLIARYCWTLDAGDSDGWADLWTADGEFCSNFTDEISGRAALRKVPADTVAFAGDGACHKAVDLFCDYGEEDGTLVAHFYNYVTHWRPGQPVKPYVMARCRMTLVRDGEGWLIRRNEAQMLISGDG